MKDIIILGSGGNCIDILDTINEINLAAGTAIYNCLGFLDDAAESQGKEFFGVKVIGALQDASGYNNAFFVNGIGSPFNFWKKKEIIGKTGIPVNRFETIIHPSAAVSKMAAIGNGTVILQNVVITSNVKIGDHIIILPNCVISHDDTIGDYTCITGGVCISGGVTVGTHCYLGTNSSIKGNITIGDNCLIGMGSNVLNDVASNSVVTGNPAKFLRKTLP
jgi:sugar O-acyltransferase (sialic acid O-acetyltransferase NeuD family)